MVKQGNRSHRTVWILGGAMIGAAASYAVFRYLRKVYEQTEPYASWDAPRLLSGDPRELKAVELGLNPDILEPPASRYVRTIKDCRDYPLSLWPRIILTDVTHYVRDRWAVCLVRWM